MPLPETAANAMLSLERLSPAAVFQLLAGIATEGEGRDRDSLFSLFAGILSPCLEVIALHTLPVPATCICMSCQGDITSDRASHQAQGAGRDRRKCELYLFNV